MWIVHEQLVFVQVGPIPYGKVFGEKFGYATIGEFVAYMDGYTLSPWSGTNHSTFQAPLYVFDSEVLQENFLDQYNITGSSLSVCTVLSV